MFNVITAIVISAAAVLGTWLGVHEIAQNQDDATRALLIKNGVDSSLAVGASAPISALTEKTTLQGSDTMVIVDNGVSPATTKKITVTNATTSMKAYWDSVYSPIFSTSAGLRGLLSDETGSGGAAVFATGPTLSSPILNTPTLDVAGTDATGDIYYNGGSGVLTRLPAGSSNEFLRISGGIPDWDNTALLTNPQTASSTFTATTTIEASNLLNKALILNGLAYKWPSVRGASSTVLVEDGTGDLRYYQKARILHLNTSPNGINNTTASTTVFAYDVPANLLGTSNVITVTIPFDSLQLASNQTQIFQASYGGASTTFANGVVTNSVGSTLFTKGEVHIYLVGNGATNSQKLIMNMVSAQNPSAAGVFVQVAGMSVSNTIATDSTASKQLLLVVKQSAGLDANDFTPTMAKVYLEPI